jgi:acyl-CoA thioesterase-2
MHGYFLRKGDASQDIIYNVLRLRDGESYSSRMVTALQSGKAAFVLIASFQRPDPGNLVHAEVMPKVPEPEGLPTENEYYLRLAEDPRCPVKWREMLRLRSTYNNPIDMRYVVAADFLYEFGMPPPDTPRFPILSSEHRHVAW